MSTSAYFKCHHCSFRTPRFRRRANGTTASPDSAWARLSSHIQIYHGIFIENQHEQTQQDFEASLAKDEERDSW
jgi:hypothetical protein